MKRNKAMNFGGHSPYPVETARPFMVIRAIMAPLALNRVKDRFYHVKVSPFQYYLCTRGICHFSATVAPCF